MDKNRVKFAARPPRHEVVADDPALEMLIETDTETLPVRLLNLSRQGTRFRAAAILHIGESVVLRLTSGDDLDQRVAANIRWRGDESDGQATYGCEFDQNISWETLGELLLRGVLAS
jgi:hypothetical protein